MTSKTCHLAERLGKTLHSSCIPYNGAFQAFACYKDVKEESCVAIESIRSQLLIAQTSLVPLGNFKWNLQFRKKIYVKVMDDKLRFSGIVWTYGSIPLVNLSDVNSPHYCNSLLFISSAVCIVTNLALISVLIYLSVVYFRRGVRKGIRRN